MSPCLRGEWFRVAVVIRYATALLVLGASGCCLFRQPVDADLDRPAAVYEHLKFVAQRLAAPRFHDSRFTEELHRAQPSVLAWNTLSYADQARGLWRFENWVWPYVRHYSPLLVYSRLAAVDPFQDPENDALLTVTLYCKHGRFYATERILVRRERDPAAVAGSPAAASRGSVRRAAPDGSPGGSPSHPTLKPEAWSLKPEAWSLTPEAWSLTPEAWSLTPEDAPPPRYQWHLASAQPFLEGSKFIGPLIERLRQDLDDGRGFDPRRPIPSPCTVHGGR